MTQESKDLHFMNRALELAERAGLHGEVPVGAVVVCDGVIVAEAANNKESRKSPIGHAEMVALDLASQALGRWRLAGCTLYVTLEPCLMCAGALVQSRVDRVVYACSDPKAGAVESLYQVLSDERLNHRPQIVAGVAAAQASNMLRQFFRNRRQNHKLGARFETEF